MHTPTNTIFKLWVYNSWNLFDMIFNYFQLLYNVGIFFGVSRKSDGETIWKIWVLFFSEGSWPCIFVCFWEVDVLPPVDYEVLYSNELCDPELSSMIPLDHPMDVQSCANAVLRNYGKARGCSKVFVYAHPNWCMCVRYGDECARRDSGGWVSIYKMCPEDGCTRHPGLDDVIILEKVDASNQF